MGQHGGEYFLFNEFSVVFANMVALEGTLLLDHEGQININLLDKSHCISDIRLTGVLC